MIFNSFNNRDWSLFIWSIGFLVLVVWVTRKDIPGLLKAFFKLQILTPVILMFGYVYTCILILSRIGLWNSSMLKDAILWTIGVGFLMFFKAGDASKGKFRLRDAFFDNLKMVVVIEFIVNLYVFRLWIELMLVPIMTVLAVLIAYSEKKPEFKAVHKFFNVIATISGLILIYHAVKALIFDFKGFATFANLENFLFPIIMTGMYLPFIYMLTLYMAYEEFFVRIKMAYQNNPKMRKFAKWQILRSGNLNLKRVIKLARNLHIIILTDKEEFKKTIKSIKYL